MKNLKLYLYNIVSIGAPCFVFLDIEENNTETVVKTTVVLVFLILRFTSLEIRINEFMENDK
jgi:hypothetical protein